MFGQQFYPTPAALADKMLAKVRNEHASVYCDPSAGDGALLEAVKRKKTPFNRWDSRDKKTYLGIEIDPALQSILRGKEEMNITILDSDFLAYPGGDRVDVWLMNPPFADGDAHLLHALEIAYDAEVVCLLNAETLRNPYTHQRQALLNKLTELDAEIEYISGAFSGDDARRKTDVNIALIYCKVAGKDFGDLTEGMTTDDTLAADIEFDQALDTRRGSIDSLVQEYLATREAGIKALHAFYSNGKRLLKFMDTVVKVPGTYGDDLATDNYDLKHTKSYTAESIRAKYAARVEQFTTSLRKTYWTRVADEIDEIRAKLTSDKRKAFDKQIATMQLMEFSSANIRQFALTLSLGYEDTITDAILKVFDWLTVKHSYRADSQFEKNVWMYNGWKTNDARKLNKRVVLPIYSLLGSYGMNRVDYYHEDALSDLDKVFSYFNEGGHDFGHLISGINNARQRGEWECENSMFKVRFFKKGTIHVTFKKPEVVERINIFVGRTRKWLPPYYGEKPYEDLTPAEKTLVQAYEEDGNGEKAYRRRVQEQPRNLLVGVNPKFLPQLEHKTAPVKKEPEQVAMF